jgi:hypothetical protein
VKRLQKHRREWLKTRLIGFWHKEDGSYSNQSQTVKVDKLSKHGDPNILLSVSEIVTSGNLCVPRYIGSVAVDQEGGIIIDTSEKTIKTLIAWFDEKEN